jgi:hypothetical protein
MPESNSGNLLGSFPSQIATSILTLLGPPLDESIWHLYPAECPPLSNCGVIVSFPVWNRRASKSNQAVPFLRPI